MFALTALVFSVWTKGMNKIYTKNMCTYRAARKKTGSRAFVRPFFADDFRDLADDFQNLAGGFQDT